jgi:hypothetical protein
MGGGAGLGMYNDVKFGDVVTDMLIKSLIYQQH